MLAFNILLATLSLVSAQIVIPATPVAIASIVATPSPSSILGTITVQGNVLGPLSCSANAVVGIVASATVNGIVSICACVQVLNTPTGSTRCPGCPANASAICSGSGVCGCACNTGYVPRADGSCGLQASAAARRAKKSLVFNADNMGKLV